MSGTTSRPSKAATLARVQAIIAGTQKHTPNGSFTIGNATFTTQSLVQLLQGLADAIAKANEAQASAKEAVAALRLEQAKVDPVLLDYTRILIATYGTAVQMLADYGLQPRKARKPLTSAQNTAAVAKRDATRKARGTTSKKQKLAVHGDVTGVIVTPVTASTQPASPATQTASNASSAAATAPTAAAVSATK
jgi:hypothetical protein